MDIFPRVSLCDILIRRMGNIQRYTIQCSLNLNLFNEKIYMFLWFWYMFVLVLTVGGFLQWLFRVIYPCDRINFIQNQLEGQLLTKSDNKLCAEFVWKYLKSDGAFVLRMISHNTNSVASRDITQALWQHWVGQKEICNGGVGGHDFGAVYITAL